MVSGVHGDRGRHVAMLEVTMVTNVDAGQGLVIIHLQPMEEPIAEERVWRSPTAQVISFSESETELSLCLKIETFSQSVRQSRKYIVILLLQSTGTCQFDEKASINMILLPFNLWKWTEIASTYFVTTHILQFTGTGHHGQNGRLVQRRAELCQ